MNPKLNELVTNPPDLPVARRLGEVREALRDGAVVVQAPPGTGKTTLIPPLVADYLHSEHSGALDRRDKPRVIVTQPRRVAARAAARRIASLLGEEVGQSVGFSVRGESKSGPGTLIEMVTPGVLVRRLQRDPELPGVGAIVLDEVHERQLDSDLAMAFAVDVREALREDLLLVAMSATVAAERTATLIGGQIVDIPGDIFPVDIRWAPPARGSEALGVVGQGTGVRREFLTHVSSVVRRALDDVPAGDVLVFAPGVREVEEIAGQLSGCGAEVDRLYGSLPAREQDRVLGRAAQGTGTGVADWTIGKGGLESAARRVVVTTSVAESSLTVPGVRIVVDGGLSREPRTDYGRGISGLVTVHSSQAAGTQRAGRAGREGPGTVYRCMDEISWVRRPAQAEPEIRTADLTGFVLEAACWGAAHARGLALLDEPILAAVMAAEDLLVSLGALDGEGRPTPLGQQLAQMPLAPRLGKALIVSGNRLGVEICALLEEELRIPGADLAGGWRRASASSAAWRQQVRRLERLVKTAPKEEQRRARAAGGDEEIAVVVASAYPERLARMKPGGKRYLLANGTGAVLPEHSTLEGEKWLAIAQLDRPQGRADAVIRAAVALDEPLALRLGQAQMRSHDEIVMKNGRLYQRATRALGAIELSAQDVPCSDAEAAGHWLAQEISAGRFALSWSEEALQLRSRMAFLHATVGEPWPDVSHEALASRLDEWAGLEIGRFVSGGKLGEVKAGQLERLFPWPDALRLDELAPERIEVPTGQTRRVAYSDGRPMVRLRVQEAFGWTETPRLAGVAVTLELLSPAQRPLAVTDDLQSFWAGPYKQVRAEMRGRYPRHPWPEDPAHAAPTRRAKPRK
ncbi:ATP-dependent helicase HrpB [Actinomycetaceae bacterium L2_0104]